MHLNFLVTAIAAVVPLILGFIWYHPRFLGSAWMKASGMNDEKAGKANMPLILGLSLLFSFMVALTMNFIVIHQMHVYSILIKEPGFGDPESAVGMLLKDFMAKYGSNYRTFKHGVFHGVVTGIMLAVPLIGTHALYERKSFAYIAINSGFWIINFALMGGIISAFA